MSETPPTIAWLDWSTAAFEQAAREHKPVLLSLVAPWCEHCAVMDRATYARPDIVRLVDARFVPVRVDTDRRPDINERYNLGGWPTTAFLTPEGEILGGGTFVDADEMPEVLASVASAFTERRAEIDARTAGVRDRERHERTCAAPVEADRHEDPLEWLTARVLELFDAEHGGFGERPKFPHAPALTLALECYADTGDPRFAQIVTTSLDHLSRLHDNIEGGFFRYASNRNWTSPHTEKVLSDNAALVRLYVDAGAMLHRGDYLEDAGRALRWVQATLADSTEGGFAASQAADGAYYGLESAEARASRAAPRVDHTQYTDSNAEMVATYMRAADVTGEGWLRDFAIRSLERTILATYRPGSGVAHVSAPGPDVWGLLADQVCAADTLLWAHAATGQLPYSMLAAELMEYAVLTMWDEERGAFQDRARGGDDAACGLLRRPLRPFALNCNAARVLYRLSLVTNRSSYRDRAECTLASLNVAYREDPLLGTSYGLAVREVRDGRLPSGLSLSYVDWRLSEREDE